MNYFCSKVSNSPIEKEWNICYAYDKVKNTYVDFPNQSARTWASGRVKKFLYFYLIGMLTMFLGMFFGYVLEAIWVSWFGR